MRESGLVGVSRRRGTRTTRVDRNHRAAPDRVERQFRADAPDTIWVADVTYVPTWNGFVYLAIVLDVFSRKVVGWAMANHLRTELVLEALNMAIAQRRPDGVIHHSDKGAQYTSLAFGKRCRDRGIVTSTGSAGDCYDNAMAESFFATLECELIDRRSFRTQAEARMAIFAFLEGWYNTKRRHSRLGVPEPQRVRTPRGGDRQAGPGRSRPRANRPRALPDRPAGDPQPPSGGTLNSGLPERSTSTGYRPPQCRWRQPSTVHRIGLTPVSKRDDKTLSASQYKALRKRYRTILTQGARELPPIPPRQNGQRGKVAKSDAHNLWERMQKHETAVLRFAKHPDVAFTNNRAERDLRMSKVKQKVSGCFRTRKYAQAYCRISSYLQSMANQGYNPLVAIQIALAGRAIDNMGE